MMQTYVKDEGPFICGRTQNQKMLLLILNEPFNLS